MSRALFIGRFQPFHKGHLAILKHISRKFDETIIGIGSSQEKNTIQNPFSYNERKLMISKTLKDNKIKKFKIYPIPDLYDDIKWTRYIIKNIPKFNVAYSGNEWIVRCFKKHKIKCEKIKLIRGINSTMIREMMAKKKNWQGLVPKEAVGYIQKIRGVEKIKRIYFNINE